MAPRNMVNRFFDASTAFTNFQQVSMLPELHLDNDPPPADQAYRVRRIVKLLCNGEVMTKNEFEQVCTKSAAFLLEHGLRRYACATMSSVQASTAPYTVQITIEIVEPGTVA